MAKDAIYIPTGIASLFTYFRRMDERFDLPVNYKGEELLFPAELLAYGYSHKIKVQVGEHEVLFEPDEERNYRAIVDPTLTNDKTNFKRDLLEAIAQAIHQIVT